MWFNLFLFVMTTASMSYALTRSKGFKLIREWASRKDRQKNYVEVDQIHVPNNLFYWFLNYFFECYYCNGFWTAIVAYTLLHFEVYFVCYFLTGALFTLIIISLIKRIKDF